jgi:hypoxanthine phosphoribosyltransferase
MQYFFTDYNWIERQISLHSEKIKQLGITDVVGVGRGGIYPALLAAFILDLPKIHIINYDRNSSEINWQGYRQIDSNSVVLLCEDVAGDGNTLVDCFSYIKEKTDSLYTLTICHDVKSKITPDFSCNFDDIICIFPWERYSFNPDARNEYKKNRKLSKNDSEYYKYGSDLDGIFLPDIDDSLYHENLEKALKDRALLKPYSKEIFPKSNNIPFVIISGRPKCDTEVTKNWLINNKIEFSELFLRDNETIDFKTSDDHYTKAERSAESKAIHIKQLGITHYFESDPLQALLIADKLPMVKVCWWNNKLMVRKWVNAENYNFTLPK